MTTDRKRKPVKTQPSRLGSVIALGNQKGGVGKSTVTVNLAAALGELGHRVLILDMDPSGGATHHLGVDPYAYEGTVELLTQQADPRELAITEGMPKNVSLIAARDELAVTSGSRIKQLKACLSTIRPLFEFILLDTPPNPKSPNTLAAYASAEWFLFVTIPHALSVRGLSEALRDVGTARQRENPDLEILGVVFNAVDTRSLALRDTRSFLSKHKNLRPFGAKGFIPWSVYLNRAAEQGTSIFQLKGYRHLPINKRFKEIAKAVAARCFDRNQFLASVAAEAPAQKKKTA